MSRYTEFHQVVVGTLRDQLPYLERTLLDEVGHQVLGALTREFGDNMPARGRVDF